MNGFTVNYFLSTENKIQVSLILSNYRKSIIEVFENNLKGNSTHFFFKRSIAVIRKSKGYLCLILFTKLLLTGSQNVLLVTLDPIAELLVDIQTMDIFVRMNVNAMNSCAVLIMAAQV